MRTKVMLVVSGVALAGALAGCASAESPAGAAAGSSASGGHSATSSPSPSPSTLAPSPSPSPSAPSSPPGSSPGGGAAAGRLAVSLGATFSPGTVRLRVGDQFLLTVSPSVEASGLSCGRATGALLSVQCPGPSQYLYTATGPGSTTISAEVKPNCRPHSVCPQWVALPRLVITILPVHHP